jgi:hypothetical protein
MVDEKQYKFDEGKFLDECRAYIDSTYSEHYAGKAGTNKNIQLMELLGANDVAFKFAQGAAMKYTLRYGKKGGFNKKDLLKAMHYLIFMSYYTPEGDDEVK